MFLRADAFIKKVKTSESVISVPVLQLNGTKDLLQELVPAATA